MSDVGPTANTVGPPPQNVAQPTPIPIYETNPTGITLHRIEDHELEALTNISRPIALAVAGAAAGGLLGLVPGGFSAFDHLSSKSVTGGDMVTLLLCGGCAVAAVIAWPMAIMGQIKAATTLKAIRGRNPSQL